MAFPALSLRVEVRRSGSLVSTVNAERATVEHNVMGGCVRGDFVFARDWTDGLVAQPGDDIRLFVGGVQHFSGRVDPVDRNIAAQGEQHVVASGWWARLKRIRPLSSTPTVDRVEYGVESTANPTLKTAYQIAVNLIDTYAVADSLSPLTRDSTTVSAPPYSTKVGLWALRQNTSIADALEQLATMDDAFTGVTADGRIYYLTRASIIGGSAQVTAALGSVPESSKLPYGVVVLGGMIREEYDLVSEIGVAARDINGTRSIRVYSDANASSPGRRVTYYAPEIMRGQSARRFAAGKLRRFGVLGTRLKSCQIVTAQSATIEPWKGRLVLNDIDDSTLDEGHIGRVAYTYGPDITLDLSVGELATNVGTGDPANDPLAPDFTSPDDPIVDIGETSSIDFTDGEPSAFSLTGGGDGDDLHSNASRDTPADAGSSGSGSGSNGELDYDPDEADDTNGATRAYLLTPRSARITAKPSTGVYHVKLTDEQGNVQGSEIQFCETFPTANDDSYEVDDDVMVFYRASSKATKPSIFNGGGGGGGGDAVHAFTSAGAFFVA